MQDACIRLVVRLRTHRSLIGVRQVSARCSEVKTPSQVQQYSYVILALMGCVCRDTLTLPYLNPNLKIIQTIRSDILFSLYTSM